MIKDKLELQNSLCMIIEEKDLFDKLYKLYDETKDTSEPFTFWVKPRAKSGIFNGTQNTTYTNVGIVQIQSSYFREPFVGFRFRGNEVVLRIGKASEKTDVDKFINKAQKNNTLLTEDQIVMFLEEAQKQLNAVNAKIEVLGSHSGQLYEALKRIECIFDKIRNVPSERGIIVYLKVLLFPSPPISSSV